MLRNKSISDDVVLFGKVYIDILPDGSVKRVIFSGDVRRYANLQRCLKGAVKTWEFPKSLEGASYQFLYQIP
jgi:hypothetical protein